MSHFFSFYTGIDYAGHNMASHSKQRPRDISNQKSASIQLLSANNKTKNNNYEYVNLQDNTTNHLIRFSGSGYPTFRDWIRKFKLLLLPNAGYTLNMIQKVAASLLVG